MKKIFVFLLLFLMLGVSVVVASNTQKIHSVNSELYQAITYLYIQSGYALPSTAGPYSSDELIMLLTKVDRSSLAKSAQESYDWAVAQLQEGNKAFKFGLDAALEAYIHTDTENFTDPTDWIRGFDERKPLLDIKLETWPSKHFYGYTSFPIMATKFSHYTKENGLESKFFGEELFTTNIFLVPPGELGDLDLAMPYRAFGAVGGEGWSVEIGRDKLSWGPGVTGNFMLGDHLKYHNQGRVTTYGKNFKYTFVTSFFPHPDQYYPIVDNNGFVDNDSQTDPIDGLNMFIGHRLEWRMFKDRVGLAISESIMYQSETNLIDLRFLSPTAILHNFYIRSNSNSLLTLEADYSPIKYLNIYGQLAVDEFALPGEPVPGKDDWALPSAYGYMVGVKSSYPMGKGVFYGSFEWVQTDPYLYLRDQKEYTQAQGEWGINYLAAIREYFDGGSIGYDEQFIGYQYGPDAIVFNLNGGYNHFGKWSAEANFFYMLHGTHDKWTAWSAVNNKDVVDDEGVPYIPTPTEHHYTYNHGDPTATDTRNAVSKTFAIGMKGSYTIIPSLKVYGGADFINIVNPGNRKENAPVNDFQLTVGLSYSL